MKIIKPNLKITKYFPILFSHKNGKIPPDENENIRYSKKDYQLLKDQNLGLNEQHIADVFFIVEKIRQNNPFINEISATIERKSFGNKESKKEIGIMDYIYLGDKQFSKDLIQLSKVISVIKISDNETKTRFTISSNGKKMISTDNEIFIRKITNTLEAFISNEIVSNNFIDHKKYGKSNLQTSEFFRLELAHNLLDYINAEYKTNLTLRNKYLIIGYLFSFAGIEVSKPQFHSSKMLSAFYPDYNNLLNSRIRALVRVPNIKR